MAAGIQIPFPPGCDHPDARLQRVIAELEPHLIVALSGGAMGHRIGADLPGDFDLPLGDQGPGDRGAQKIRPFIERIGPEHGKDVIADEFLAQIFDEDLACPHHLGFFPGRLELFALAEIGGEGHDLATVIFLQPAQDDRGIEPARIGQHHLLDVAFLGRAHGKSTS